MNKLYQSPQKHYTQNTNRLKFFISKKQDLQRILDVCACEAINLCKILLVLPSCTLLSFTPQSKACLNLNNKTSIVSIEPMDP